MMGLKPTALRALYTLWPKEAVVKQADVISHPGLNARAIRIHLANLNGIRDGRYAYSCTQRKAVQRYNRDIGHRQLLVGDLVMVYQKDTSKFEPRWRGPFRIRKTASSRKVSFILEQLDGTLIRNHYHGDHLRLFVPRESHLVTGLEPSLLSSQTLRRPPGKHKKPQQFLRHALFNHSSLYLYMRLRLTTLNVQCCLFLGTYLKQSWFHNNLLSSTSQVFELGSFIFWLLLSFCYGVG